MIKFKKYGVLFLALSLIFSLTIAVEATEEDLIRPPGIEKFPIRILHNGNYVEAQVGAKDLAFKEVLAPLRFILERADYKVDWNKNGMVTIEKDGFKTSFNSKKPNHKMENIKGNILVDLDFFKQFDDLKLSYDELTRTLIFKTDRLEEDDIFYYDLGERVMPGEYTGDFNYRLNGAISFPDKEKSPLVIMLHGAHATNKAERNRYDLGFSYLMKDLKKAGYASMSLNVGINYSWEAGEPFDSQGMDHLFEETIKELDKANRGEDNSFGIDLENKLDLDKVFFFGHSRSGQEIFRLANEYRDDDRINVRGIISLAASRMYEMDYSLVDLPVAIILPQLDGDVIGLDGHWIFDDLMDLENRQSESQMVYLYGANHNGFNQAILMQDEGDDWFTGEKFMISPEEEREFLKIYSKEFIKNVLEGKSLYENIRNDGESLFGYKALLSSFVPGQRVYNSDYGLEQVEAKNAQAEILVYSDMAGDNTIGGFSPPGSSNALNLLNMRWTEKNASVNFKLKDSVKDPEKLILYMAQDSTSDLNKKKNQAFTVTIVDQAGKEYKVKTKKDHHVLRYHEGEVVDDIFYSTHTPLGFLEIKLDEFKGLDRNKIASVRLDFTENKTGSLMLRHIQFN